MDGWTNTVFIGRSLSTGRAMYWTVNPSGKNSIRCQTYAKTEDHIELKTVFQCSASPASILSTTENAIFVHFMEKSMHLKTGFLSDYQVLFLQNKFIV